MRDFRSQLASKFLLKYHIGLILLGTAFSGVLANRWLLDLGLGRIVIRYPAAVLFSFSAFLLLMRIWLTYISRAFQPTNIVSEFEDPEPKSATTPKSSKWDWWNGSGADLLPEGALFLIVVVGIFIIAFSLIAEAPLILAEAAFQFLLAARLIRTAKQIDNPDWVGSVFSRTWKPFVVIFVATLLLGICAETSCKNPTTIKEMIKSCGNDGRI